jgi:hypothetical protein
MRAAAAIVTLGLILSLSVQAQVPFPDSCEVSPWDEAGQFLGTPGTACHFDEVTFIIRDVGGNPVPGAFVQVLFEGCDDAWLIQPLEGFTGGVGELVLNPSAGGCDDCGVRVRANGVTIRLYPLVRTTDWDGTSGNGTMTGADFSFFATAFKVTQDTCADYNGSGTVTSADFALFACAFALAE